jgi:hypothetical protein
VPPDAEPSWFALGLRPGDVIETENGSPIGERVSVFAGRTVLGISRKGKPMLVYITVHGDSTETGKLDDQDMQKLAAATQPFSQPVRDRSGPSGVRITDTILALYAKLSVGDLVRTVDGRPIRSDAEFAAAIRGLRIGATDIVLDRFGHRVTVTLTREPPMDLTTIKRLGPTSFELPRALVDAIDGDLRMLVRTVKLVPAVSKGTVHGYRLFEVDKDPLYTALGLQNEDILLDVDGFSIDSQHQAYEARHKLISASKITLHVVRRGQRLTMTYAIR